MKSKEKFNTKVLARNFGNFSTRMLLTIVFFSLIGLAIIYISYDLAENDVKYYVIREIGKGILITSLISGVIKWYLQREFTKELNLIKEIKDDNLSMSLLSIEKSVDKQTKQITDYSLSLGAMLSSGVTRFYKNRGEAGEDINSAMQEALKSAEGTIKIVGISLNDFTRDEVHVLHEAWNKVQDYVNKVIETNSNVNVQALVLDPLSKGGYLRSNAEKQEDTSPRLTYDVKKAIGDFRELEVKSEGNDKVNFEARLYRTSPILYMVWTNNVAFVQQYYFRPKHQADVNIPVLKYVPKTGDYEFKIHKELEFHFNWLWNSASISIKDYIDSNSRGTFEALKKARIENIYYDSAESRKRIISLIQDTQEVLCLKGISLHSYFHRNNLTQAIINACKRGVKVNVLLIDPHSEQANIRSYRELKFNDETISYNEFKSNAELISEQRLYIDTTSSIRNIKILKKELKKHNCDDNLRLKLYRSAPEAFLLITDESLIIEQYHYGKIGVNDEKIVLGKDVPIFEYKKSKNKVSKVEDPYRIYRDHFYFVRDHFSNPPE